MPAAALDVLAPLVCHRASGPIASVASDRAHVRSARKWLQTLLRSSLLSGSVADRGVSAHDLVRDVMIARASSEQGGMLTLQREVAPGAVE